MIDDTQIQYLERLARIRLDPAQRDAFREEIGRILTYMERLAAIDGLPPAPLSAAEHPAGDGPREADGAAGSIGTADPIGAADSIGAASGSFGLESCRPDIVRPSLARGDLLAMSPQATDECLTVPLAVT